MTLLIAIVLFDVVQVVTTDYNGALHLGRDDLSSEDASTDRDVSGKGALLVNVGTADGSFGGLEAKTNILEPASSLALRNDTLVVLEDGFLLLEGAVSLTKVGDISVCSLKI